MFRKILTNKQLLFGLSLIIIFIIIAIFAPLIAPNNPYEVDISKKFLTSSPDFPLGTDQLGRCVLSRLVYGARYSLSIAFPSLFILALDRKSTRLNSSHANISYAVFCLKKKTRRASTYTPPP